jgi:phosphomevalonate kinase
MEVNVMTTLELIKTKVKSEDIIQDGIWLGHGPSRSSFVEKKQNINPEYLGEENNIDKYRYFSKNLDQDLYVYEFSFSDVDDVIYWSIISIFELKSKDAYNLLREHNGWEH